MGHVFISYARADRDYAARLARLLTQAGVSVWLDDRIEPGSHYDDVIEKALDEAERVIVLWSTASVASQWVRAEAAEGHRRGVLVPIATDRSKIPLEFRRVQALDFTDWRKTADEDCFRALTDHLDRRPDRAQPTGAVEADKPQIHASLISLDRFHGTVRIRLGVGDQSYRLEHISHPLRQSIKLNGHVVAKGGSWRRLEDYFLLENLVPGTKRIELLLSGDRLLGLDRAVLRIDRREVLNATTSIGRGVAALIVATVGSVLLFAIGLEAFLVFFDDDYSFLGF